MNYQRVYNQIIEKARTRVHTGYVERHHIIPKAHGGTNDAANIVNLTAREHFIVHWILYRLHRDAAMARAFRLLCDSNGKRRSRDYEQAKIVYATSMRGDTNIAKQTDVRQKISKGLAKNHAFRGKKRPEHSVKMKVRGHWDGSNNPWFGTGARQLGAKNHMARTIIGIKDGVIVEWDTLTAAANALGVTIQAVFQAIKKEQKTKGWKMEYKQ